MDLLINRIKSRIQVKMNIKLDGPHSFEIIATWIVRF